MMTIQSYIFDEVKQFIPNSYSDDRGFFSEVYNSEIQEQLGVSFVQDNLSKSSKFFLSF